MSPPVRSTAPDRIAAIDIGTNSVLLLVVEGDAGQGYAVLEERCTITRIGKGVDQSGLLAEDRVAQTLEVLRDYVSALRSLGVQTAKAIGTSALRDASNGAVFLREAQSILGSPVEIVSGTREAELVLGGVRSTFPELGPEALVFDIGGGSTEFIIPNEADLEPQVISLNIGTVRLTERHIHQDPPDRETLDTLKRAIDAELAALPPVFSDRAATLIGVAGTVTTLAALSLQMEDYDGAAINGFCLALPEIDRITDQLLSLSLDERKRLPGLMPQRADVIISGAILTGAILRFFKVDHCRVCDRGVRWGAIYEGSN